MRRSVLKIAQVTNKGLLTSPGGCGNQWLGPQSPHHSPGLLTSGLMHGMLPTSTTDACLLFSVELHASLSVLTSLRLPKLCG